MFKAFLKDESGATAIEYGLIAALVALGGVAAFTGLGTTVQTAFTDVATALCTGAGGKTYTATTSGGTCQ
jgi:pilus assembly protein Flp/PilA